MRTTTLDLYRHIDIPNRFNTYETDSNEANAYWVRVNAENP